MVTHAAAAALALGIAISGAVLDTDTPPGYTDLGECRITTYCPSCNTGAGHASSSGVWLEYGHAACNWLPLGTVINIEGEEFEIVDTCGTDAIDLFIDTEYCRCDLNEYKRVYVVKGADE